jgi:peptidoglycan/xylan/chitin deacetylase (PgdA/CDA1 family)
MYHRIISPVVDPWSLCVSPEHFAEHLAVLRRWARPISLSELWDDRAKQESLPSVVLTFDDGYADNLLAAVPLLQAERIPATVFVTTTALDGGREFWWDELEALLLNPGTLPVSLDLRVGETLNSYQLGSSADYDVDAWTRQRSWRAAEPPPGQRQEAYLALWRQLWKRSHAEQQAALASLSALAPKARTVRPACRTLTLAELRLLAESEGIDIGGHTMTHPVLPEWPRAVQQWELQQNKARLESVLGRPVNSLAYPYGAHSEETADLARELGFTVACTTQPGLVDRATDGFRVPRVQVEDWTGAVFEDQLLEWLAGGQGTQVNVRTGRSSRAMTTNRVVQSLWVGGHLSTIGRLGLQSFLAHGHDVHLYCYEPVPDAPPGTTLLDAREILSHEAFLALLRGPGADAPAAASNAFRFKLLLDRGGWWIDTDVVCLRPLDFVAESVFAAEPADAADGGAAVIPSVIKQPPGSPLMRWSWGVCREESADHTWPHATGSRLLHRGIEAFGWQDDVCLPTVFSPVPRADWRSFTDPERTFSFGPEVHAITLWQDMWRTHGVNPDGLFEFGCLYEQLRRRYLTA